jgi:hypothetical protein
VSKRKKATRGGARPGAGRKPILQNRVGLTVQFDGDVYERLAELSEKREKSIGSLVREAVAAYLTRRGKR